jgi:Kdo2-lipid IVA lauroyltransferase/acyltransferase
MYSELWKILPESMWISQKDDTEIFNYIEGYDELESYIKTNHQDTGVIYVSAHLGAWELIPHIISKRIAPVVCIYKPSKINWLNNFMLKIRSDAQFSSIEKDGSIVKIFKELKRGKSVGMVVDQHGGEGGVDSSFLGAPCKSWEIMATLSNKTTCPIVPVCLIRNGDKYKVLWDRAIIPELDAQGKIDIPKTTLIIDNVLSRFVRCAPEQWMWLGRRWGRDFEILMQEKK